MAEVKATEAAEREAKELGVDLSTVTGTGSEGRITVDDVRAAGEVARQTKENQKEAERQRAGMATSGTVNASALAQKKAKAYGIDIEDVESAGYVTPDGRVSLASLNRFISEEGIDAPASGVQSVYVKLLGGKGVVPGTGYTATIYEEGKRPRSATVSNRTAHLFTEGELEAILDTGRKLYGLEEEDFQIVPAATTSGTPIVRPASSADIRQRRIGAVARPLPAPAIPEEETDNGPGTPGTEAPVAGSPKEQPKGDPNPNDSPDDNPLG